MEGRRKEFLVLGIVVTFFLISCFCASPNLRNLRACPEFLTQDSGCGRSGAQVQMAGATTTANCELQLLLLVPLPRLIIQRPRFLQVSRASSPFFHKSLSTPISPLLVIPSASPVMPLVVF
jgi:hypothetical protein